MKFFEFWSIYWNVITFNTWIYICSVIIGSSVAFDFENLRLCLQTGSHVLEAKTNKITPQDFWKLLK